MLPRRGPPVDPLDVGHLGEKLGPFVGVGLVDEEGVDVQLFEIEQVFLVSPVEEVLYLASLFSFIFSICRIVRLSSPLGFFCPDELLELADLVPDVGGFLLRGHGDHVEQECGTMIASEFLRNDLAEELLAVLRLQAGSCRG